MEMRKTFQRWGLELIQFTIEYVFPDQWVAMEKKRMDITLSKFLVGIVKIVILAFAAIIALGKFGITISPFLAAIGAVAFGGTLALQGTLANYGAGLSIILSRPFVVGNTITVAGASGVVEEVRVFSSRLVDAVGR
jgi:small conductance mechanosensitive channel